jgi:hypothetical protein
VSSYVWQLATTKNAAKRNISQVGNLLNEDSPLIGCELPENNDSDMTLVVFTAMEIQVAFF